jgi:hypothetical protein
MRDRLRPIAWCGLHIRQHLPRRVRARELRIDDIERRALCTASQLGCCTLGLPSRVSSGAMVTTVARSNKRSSGSSRLPVQSTPTGP